MERKNLYPLLLFILVFILISIACATTQPIPTGTSEPTSTLTAVPTATQTPRPSPTPRPTWTPDIVAPRHIEELIAEVQVYYEKGYLTTSDGTFAELDDFSYDWADLGRYQLFLLPVSASDFFLSAHFKWNSALENSDTAGCGFIFGLQPNNDHYAVFLDRAKIYFRVTNPALGYSSNVEPNRVTGKVQFDYPAEANFTLIVKGGYAYVLVNGEVVSEYTLLSGRPLRGDLGLSVLSGTNKEYGTRCEMTDLRLWIPNSH
ncbi:MAG: hypothetical protein ACXW4E_05020 [Anaerolineales bacterium]